MEKQQQNRILSGIKAQNAGKEPSKKAMAPP